MQKHNFDPFLHFGFLTNRTGRLIGKFVDVEMKQLGFEMPSSCIGILGDLWAKDGLNQKELGMSIIKNKSSVNKMLQQLLDANLIVKKTDEADRRVTRIFLTQKGRQLQEKVIRMGGEMDESLAAAHSEKEIEIAKKVLGTLYHQLIERETVH